MILPIDIDMGVTGWPNMHQVLVLNCLSFQAKLLDNFSDVNGVPDDDEIGNQIETTDLMVELFVSFTFHLSVISKACRASSLLS